MANPGARQAGSHESSVGVQGRQPQDVPLWHIDYLELYNFQETGISTYIFIIEF